MTHELSDLRWDSTTDPQNAGWVVLCEIEPGRYEWMSPAPGRQRQGQGQAVGDSHESGTH